MAHARTGLAVALALVAASLAAAQTVEAPYDTDYVLVDLGPVPGLPPPNGGLTFLSGDPDTLLVGGEANGSTAAVYSVALTRDMSGHVSGFAGMATPFADAAWIDGGLAYGPGGVLFYTRWPNTELGQIGAMSTTTDRVVDLAPLGVSMSPGGLAFVPAGHPAAGTLKVVSYDTGEWYSLTLAPDGSGTFDVTAAALAVTVGGGPEGFIFVPAGSPQLGGAQHVLVSEWDDGTVAVYEVDANGDPVAATRGLFLSGVEGAEGAAVDPLTGDFLFSTFLGSGERIYAVRGFAVPPDEGGGDDEETPCTGFAPVGQGYWHRQCLGLPQDQGGLAPGQGRGKGPSAPTEPAFADTVLPCADALLADLGLGTTACAAMAPQPPGDGCARAERDLAQLAFNVCSDRVQTGCAIEPRWSCTATSVGGLLEEAAARILGGECGAALQCLLAAEGRGSFDASATGASAMKQH